MELPRIEELWKKYEAEGFAVLAVESTHDTENAVDFINEREKPLALYVFSQKKAVQDLFVNKTSSGSVAITSNLVFSEWDRIFKDAMTTAAAIDRLVHHSTILELTGKSYRSEAAQQRQPTEDAA